MCPANGQPIAKVVTGTVADYDRCVTKCQEAWQTWAEVTPPHRGEIVRQVPQHITNIFCACTDIFRRLGRSCGGTWSRWASWCRWRWVRSCPRAWARCRSTSTSATTPWGSAGCSTGRYEVIIIFTSAANDPSVFTIMGKAPTSRDRDGHRE